MHAHKFGEYTANDDNKTVIDNKEILDKLDESFTFYQQIIEKLDRNKKELRKRIQNGLNDVKEMIEKESYTIILNDSLEKIFDESITCENCEIALLEFNAPMSFPLTADNNIIEYNNAYIDEEWRLFRIPTGVYTKESLQTYLNSNSPSKMIERKWTDTSGRIHTKIDRFYRKNFKFEFAGDNILLEVIKGVVLRFTHPQTFGKIINADPKEFYLGGVGINEGNYARYMLSFDAPFSLHNPINIHVDCIKNNYFNDQESPIIYSFYYEKKNINEKPNHLIYHPIKEKIKTFKVEIKDKDGNKIPFDKSYLKFHIRK